MKYFTTIVCICVISSVASAQSNATIGMPIDDFKKLYPNMESTTYQHTITFTRAETLDGLDGTAGYRFEKGRLNWIYFSKYIDSINDENFKKCLAAAKQIIKDYTNKYGKPDTTIVGNTKFVDPYKKKHWGYNVMEARWKNYKGMKIKVEFTFMGGKGEYHFLVKINYFDKDYAYYD